MVVAAMLYEAFPRETEGALSQRYAALVRREALAEWTQSRALGLPAYRTLSASGPAHAPLFEVEAAVAGLGSAVATGASKRAAEQGAAGALLLRIDGDDGSGDG